MLGESLRPDATLDCTGLFCPQPIIRTAEQVQQMRSGQLLEVQATDPGFQIDLPAWCRSHHHEFLGMRRENAVFVGYVRLGHNGKDRVIGSE
jgi:TusA-related sulfurtransferase